MSFLIFLLDYRWENRLCTQIIWGRSSSSWTVELGVKPGYSLILPILILTLSSHLLSGTLYLQCNSWILSVEKHWAAFQSPLLSFAFCSKPFTIHPDFPLPLLFYHWTYTSVWLVSVLRLSNCLLFNDYIACSFETVFWHDWRGYLFPLGNFVVMGQKSWIPIKVLPATPLLWKIGTPFSCDGSYFSIINHPPDAEDHLFLLLTTRGLCFYVFGMP